MSLSVRESKVERLALRFVNAFLIRGQRTILVDTGFPGTADRLLQQIHTSGVQAGEISLIVLTHAHHDHAGNAAVLRERLKAPVVVHSQEAAWLRSGQTVIPRTLRPLGYLIRATNKTEIRPFEPDLVMEDSFGLEGYGVAGQLVHTPGHSPGSVSVVVNGGADCLVGDLLAGHLNGPGRPGYPFFAENLPRLHHSLNRLLLDYPVERFHFGHGFAASTEAVRQRFASSTGPAQR